jgi:hypothetical protein
LVRDTSHRRVIAVARELRHPEPGPTEAGPDRGVEPAVSEQTGWPIGFWWAELAHPFLEFIEHGYEVDIARPDGGALGQQQYSGRAAARLMITALGT